MRWNLGDSQELESISEDLQSEEVKMKLSSYNIICTTPQKCELNFDLMGKIHTLIVDDADCLSEIETLIPFSYRPKFIVLVGDPCSYKETPSQYCLVRNYYKSFYERAIDNSKN